MQMDASMNKTQMACQTIAVDKLFDIIFKALNSTLHNNQVILNLLFAYYCRDWYLHWTLIIFTSHLKAMSCGVISIAK